MLNLNKNIIWVVVISCLSFILAGRVLAADNDAAIKAKQAYRSLGEESATRVESAAAQERKVEFEEIEFGVLIISEGDAVIQEIYNIPEIPDAGTGDPRDFGESSEPELSGESEGSEGISAGYGNGEGDKGDNSL